VLLVECLGPQGTGDGGAQATTCRVSAWVLQGSTVRGVLVPRTEKTWLRLSRNYFLIYKTLCYFVFRSTRPLDAVPSPALPSGESVVHLCLFILLAV